MQNLINIFGPEYSKNSSKYLWRGRGSVFVGRTILIEEIVFSFDNSLYFFVE